MKTVLIVTHRRGFEADPVIDALRKRNIPVFRFNFDVGDEISKLSFFIDHNENDIFLKCDNFEIRKNKIGVGWCQQLPPFFNQPSGLSQSLQNENLWAAGSAILDLLDLTWLNKPSRVVYASNKIVQLTLAKKVGFNIPTTLISNTPNHIRNFAESNVIIAKNLATPWFVDSKQRTSAAYTKIVKHEWLSNDSELHFSPIIYQVFRDRAKDYRVIVVGEQCFVASCIPKENQLEDIRKGSSTGEDFTACDFDQDSLKALKILMKKLDVSYCAADFMEDKSGKLYFLEMNICGAWWWVDEIYDGMICEAIVDFMEKELRATC